MSFCWCDASVWHQQKVSMNAEISIEEEMIVWNRVDKTFIWLRSRFLYLYFGTKCLLYQLTKGLNNINVVRYSQLAHWAALKVNLLLLKLIHLFAREVLLVKKLEIEETKTTWYSNFKTDIIEVGLVFLISNFFITKMSLANKWTRKKIPSCSNSALSVQQWPVVKQ